MTRFRRQFLCKMWPIQLAFLLFTVCRTFLSSLTPFTLIPHTIGPDDRLHPPPTPHFRTFRLFLIYFPQCPTFTPHKAVRCESSFLKLRVIIQFSGGKNLILVEFCFCHGNTTFNFTCASCVIGYHATQNIWNVPLSAAVWCQHNLYWGRLPWDCRYVSFFPL